LRDCSREIERLAAVLRAGGGAGTGRPDPGQLRACAIEVAQIRVALRQWDIGSAPWMEALQARLKRLLNAVGLVADMDPSPGKAQLTIEEVPASQAGLTERVEGNARSSQPVRQPLGATLRLDAARAGG